MQGLIYYYWTEEDKYPLRFTREQIKEACAKEDYIERIRRTGYPMDQYFRRAARQEGHPVMTRRP